MYKGYGTFPSRKEKKKKQEVISSIQFVLGYFFYPRRGKKKQK